MNAVVEAYFDESGTHRGTPLMCVAGYIIATEQRMRFQVAWDAVLSRHSIPYFHMSDCAHGTGVFKSLAKQVRADICRSLIELIKLRAEIGIAVSVCEAEYNAIIPSGFKTDAYTFCVQECLMGVVSWATKYNIAAPIAYYFESGHKNQAVADSFINFMRYNQQLVNGLRYHSHAFLGGKQSCGIAAADLLAWEFSTAHRNKFGPTRRPVRLSFENLMRKTHIFRHYGEEHLREYFAESKAIWDGKRTAMSGKFTRFVSTRDFPEKPLGWI